MQDALLRWTRQRVDGFSAAIGLGGVLALCGAANFFRLPNAVVLPGLVVVGVGAALAYLICDFAGINRRDALRHFALPVLLFVLALPLIVDGLATDAINPHDDAYSYLLAPVQIHQTGGYRVDPFNYRMVVSNLGGLSYLQAGLLSVLDPRHVSLLDRSVGLLILIEALSVILRRHRLGLRVPALVLAPLFILDFPATVNLSATYLPIALFVSIYGLLSDGGVRQIGHVAAGSLVASGLVAVKTLGGVYAAPLIAAFLLGAVFFRELTVSEAAHRAFVAVGVGTVALVPWMLPFVMVEKVLTPLSWGTGVDDMNIGTLLSLADLYGIYKLYWPLVAFGCLAFWKVRAQRLDMLALTIGTLIAALAATLLTGAVALGRYETLVLLPALLLCGFAVLESLSVPWTRAGVALVLAMTFVQYQAHPAGAATVADKFVHWPEKYVYAHRFPSRHLRPLESQAERASAASAQARMEPGAAVLVWTERPHLFDFRRNPLHVVDFPCASSPPPGMPCHKDGPSVAQYLRDRAIRYLVYAYRRQAGFPVSMVQKRLSREKFTPWQRSLNRLVPLFHSRVAEIGTRCKTVYLDHRLVVFDLEACQP